MADGGLLRQRIEAYDPGFDSQSWPQKGSDCFSGRQIEGHDPGFDSRSEAQKGSDERL